MKALSIHPSSQIVDHLSIAAPCSASWNDMVGDERTRHCGDCSKNVFNISSMTADEVRDLIQEKEGRVCVRLFRRKDGTVLTADCPVGLAERAWRRAKRSTLAAAGLAVAIVTGAFAFLGKSTCDNPYAGAGYTTGIVAPEEHMVMGKIAPPDLEIEMGDVDYQEVKGELAVFED